MMPEKRSTRSLQNTMNRPQLFCFTYAGGKSDFFRIIENDLPDIELVAPEYPGHGTRHSEPLLYDFNELADDVFRQFKENWNGGSYGLFGYSMGTITLIEVLRRIISSGIKLPDSVFLAAHEPRTKRELSGFEKNELDDKVKERTIAFGAVPDKLAENKLFWRIYLPLYRADYTMIGRYRFEVLDLRTDIPAAVFYSETDTPLSDMMKWKDIFTQECSFHEFSGNHFFINEHHKEIAEMICGMLLPDCEVLL